MGRLFTAGPRRWWAEYTTPGTLVSTAQIHRHTLLCIAAGGAICLLANWVARGCP